MPSFSSSILAQNHDFVLNPHPPQQPGPNISLPAPFCTFQMLILAASRCVHGYARDTMACVQRLNQIVSAQKELLTTSLVGVASSGVLRVSYQSATHAQTTVRGFSTTYYHPLLTTPHPLHQCDLDICLAAFSADYFPTLSPFDSSNDILDCTNMQCRMTIHTLCYYSMFFVKIMQERSFFCGDGQNFRLDMITPLFTNFISNCLMCGKPFADMIRHRLLAAFYSYASIFGISFDFSTRAQVRSSRYVAGASRNREPPFPIHLYRNCHIKITALIFNHVNPTNFRNAVLPVLPALTETANLRLLPFSELSKLLFQCVLGRCITGTITDATIVPALRMLLKGEVDGRGSATSLYAFALERPIKIEVLRWGVREQSDQNTDTTT